MIFESTSGNLHHIMAYQEVNNAINILQKYMKEMSDEQRYKIIVAITSDYCKECGSKYLPCYCIRDE